MPTPPRQRDVFVCFSKKRAGEAAVALALKDELEQLGLYAYEYEDWKWVAASVPGDEPDVDRATLRNMLAACAVVVLISPHHGEASKGVQTEIAELQACGSPVILLHWSPRGWRALDDHPVLQTLNIVWHHEGRSMGEDAVAQNQCAHIARQLAVAAWLAHVVAWAHRRHPQTAARLLARLPEAPRDALLNLRLRRPAAEPRDWPDAVDSAALAADIAASAPAAALRDFVHQWRSGQDVLGQVLAEEAAFELHEPAQTLHEAFEALCQQACSRQPDAMDLPDTVLRDRALMLVRVEQTDEALPLLRQALRSAPPDRCFEIHQAMALALQESDAPAAIESFTHAIDCAPLPELRCSLAYNRGALRSKIPDERQRAIDDFTLAADPAASTPIRHSALRARARLHSENRDYEAALADYTQILADARATPRTAVSAWMDRGAVLHTMGRYTQAIADWTQAIAAPDAEARQRFRTLEARGQTLEKLGEAAAAADDYAAMMLYSDISPRYRDELKRKVAQLRATRPAP